jgi:antitoxin component YwqK of YwqJK toxin-antitoxin module
MKQKHIFLKGNLPLKLFLFLALLALTGCRTSLCPPDRISSINIIDRNGITETISEKNRLKPFQNTNFLTPQPYQKVVRVFGKDEKGDTHSCVTSYHPNGQIKQYLEAVNNRAHGVYREWHPNGQLKIEGTLIGGNGDIHTHAEQSWLFDGLTQAWDEEGHLVAAILYSKGELEGNSLYYHPNGTLWKTTFFSKNVPHGTEKIFLADGSVLQTTEYRQGKKEGLSLRLWAEDKIASEERFEQGLLVEGNYMDKEGNKVSQISQGCGYRALFGKESLHELHEYKDGLQHGLVKLFNSDGTLHSTYSIEYEEKEGIETLYYATGHAKLVLPWREGILQGVVKTWYPDGSLESQKEICKNKKNGQSCAWYSNGQLMLVEEYENDRLVKGEYYRMGEKNPVSSVAAGSGVATIFESNGTLHNKVTYHEGRPA